jgi:hypothetical protein
MKKQKIAKFLTVNVIALITTVGIHQLALNTTLTNTSNFYLSIQHPQFLLISVKQLQKFLEELANVLRYLPQIYSTCHLQIETCINRFTIILIVTPIVAAFYGIITYIIEKNKQQK